MIEEKAKALTAEAPAAECPAPATETPPVENVESAAAAVIKKTPQKSFWDKIHFDKWKGWVYLLPAILLLLVFTVWPIINTVRIAFLNGYDSMYETGGETYSFGVQNFVDILTYGEGFYQALRNTLLICIITVPASTFLALLIAVCLNAIKPLQRLLQTIFFLPYVTNSIAIGIVFAAIFSVVGDLNKPHLVSSIGFVNTILSKFNVAPIDWIEGEYWARMTVLCIYIIWNALPFKILILLGGLQSVNKQYYDAAKIDSTPRWRVFTRITVPLLSPMLAYVVITGFIGSFKEYSSVIGVLGENAAADPKNMITMVGMIYDYIDGRTEYGLASAAALILFVIIFIVTMINLTVSKKKTHY